MEEKAEEKTGGEKVIVDANGENQKQKRAKIHSFIHFSLSLSLLFARCLLVRFLGRSATPILIRNIERRCAVSLGNKKKVKKFK